MKDEAVPKRDRRVYIRKADKNIFKFVAEYQFITPEIMAECTGRDLKTIQKRMQYLCEANYLNRQRRDRLSPFVYFLGEEGAKLAYELGYIPILRFIKKKSAMTINHDLDITNFHRLIIRSFGDIQWEQWRGDSKYLVEAEGESFIPDGHFVLDGQFFFVERVRSYESEYEDGESNIEKKFRIYSAYKDEFRRKYGYDDYRVLWLMPTRERAKRILEKMETKYPFRRFYVTDEESYTKRIEGKIWWTPKDFRDATYSLL
jgi:Replication-relaxation